MNFIIMRNLTFAFGILVLIASCKKDSKDDFRKITITGSVYDSTGRVGMANVPVKIFWYGPVTQETSIGSTISNSQGNYSFQTKIDISRFKDQNLIVHAIVPNGYISIHDMEHTSVGASTVGYSELLKMPRFDMYQKSNLAIQMQRTATDSFSEIHVYYNYGGRNYWVYLANNPGGSVTYNVTTVAGLSTKVHWAKKYASGSTTSFQDSIICLPNTSNSITIPY